MLFQASFDPDEGLERDARWNWEGRGEVDGIYEAVVSGEGVETHIHKERHYTVPRSSGRC